MPNSSNDHTIGNNESSQLKLPPELFEVIIDHIEVKSGSLIACALVCRVFAYRCQNRLFKSITLGSTVQSSKRDIVSKIWRLYEVLSKSPNLCKLVEELEIIDAWIKSSHGEESSWIGKDSHLSKLLPMLDSLKELSIQGNNMGSMLNFRAWKPELKLAIWKRCQTVSKISLGFMRNVPLTLMRFAPSLRALSFFETIFIADDAVLSSAADPTIPAMRAELRSLRISTFSRDEWASLYPWLLLESGNPDMSRLVSLDLDVNFVYTDPFNDNSKLFGAVRRLIRRTSNTIRTLSLYFPAEEVFYNPNYFDLGSMPSLRHFSLRGCIWTESFRMRMNNVQWLLKNLAKIPQSSSLQSIHLDFTVEDCGIDGSRSKLANAGWMDFVAEINRLERSIDVSVSILILGGSVSHAKSVLNEYLAPLMEKGIAEVSYKRQRS